MIFIFYIILFFFKLASQFLISDRCFLPSYFPYIKYNLIYFVSYLLVIPQHIVLFWPAVWGMRLAWIGLCFGGIWSVKTAWHDCREAQNTFLLEPQRAVPQALTLLWRTKFIAWKCTFLGKCQRGPRHFLGPPGMSGLRQCPWPT